MFVLSHGTNKKNSLAMGRLSWNLDSPIKGSYHSFAVTEGLSCCYNCIFLKSTVLLIQKKAAFFRSLFYHLKKFYFLYIGPYAAQAR